MLQPEYHLLHPSIICYRPTTKYNTFKSSNYISKYCITFTPHWTQPKSYKNNIPLWSTDSNYTVPPSIPFYTPIDSNYILLTWQSNVTGRHIFVEGTKFNNFIQRYHKQENVQLNLYCLKCILVCCT